MALDKIKTDVITDDAITVAKMHTDTGVQPEHHKVPVYANNSARDSAIGSPAVGMIIYNTAETALQQYNGTWSTIAPAPTISSISGTINEDTNTTLTVNGSQYVSGMTIKLVLSSSGADISGHNTLSYTLVSATQITVTIPSGTSNITAGTVVQLEIIKSGLSVRSQDITVSEDPNWTTSAGTVATIYDNKGTSQTVATLAATAGAGGGTLNYASDDSSLDTNYFALNLTSGVITTHASTAITGITGSGSGSVTKSFNANAKISGDATKNTVRAFNIIVHKTPVGSGITPTEITVSGTKYLVYQFIATGTSTLTVYHTIANVEYVIIGGGGEGGQGHDNYLVGNAGSPSYFKVQGAGSNLVHVNGGGPGGAHGQTASRNGASGGGGGGGATSTYAHGGTAVANEGYAGGNSSGVNGPYVGGGGGGAGHAGQNGSGTQGGAGGIGIISSITGTAVGRAGGGGAGGWRYNNEVWAYGGAWNGTNTSAGTGGQGASGQAYGAGNGAHAGSVGGTGNPQNGGAGAANTGAGGGAGDSGTGAQHGGGGAGGYRSSVTGESSGGGASAESKLTLSANTYEVSVGAGGTGNARGGDGGSGVVILRFPIV